MMIFAINSFTAVLIKLQLFVIFCRGFQSNYPPSLQKLLHGFNATLLHHEDSQDRRRINAKTNGGDNVKCSICEDIGVPIRTDVIPLPESAPGVTCAELEKVFSLPGEKERCIELNEYLVFMCCDTSKMSVPLYKCNENIQNEVFSKANELVAPIFFGQALQIDVLLTYEALESIDIKLATANIFVYLTLSWYDPRLAWNKSQDFCSSSMSVRASNDLELTQIWVPDVDLLNRIEGVQSWSEVSAEVRYDGKVTWQRNGILVVGCTFKGLKAIPFDTLGCQLLFGSYTQNHLFELNANPGIIYGKSKRSFREYVLDENKTDVFYWDPADDGGVEILKTHIITYNLFLDRSSNFYVTKLIIPSILFTFVSFGLFFLDLRLGERLGFGLNILLVNVAQDIITNEYIPISQERLWLVTFIQGSTYWIFASLFETILISWLYFKAGRIFRNHEEFQNIKNVWLKRKNNYHQTTGKHDSQVNYHETSTGIQEDVNSKEVKCDEKASKKPSNSRIRISQLTIEQRLSWINKIDRICMFLYPLTYTIFIIVMMTNHPKHDDGDDVWVTGKSVS